MTQVGFTPVVSWAWRKNRMAAFLLCVTIRVWSTIHANVYYKRLREFMGAMEHGFQMLSHAIRD